MLDRGSEEAIIAASAGRILTGREETGEMRLSQNCGGQDLTSGQKPKPDSSSTGSVCHSCLMNSDGGNYSRWRRAVSNRVRGGVKLSRQISERERDGGASVEEEGERERMKGIELSRKFQEKVWVGC